MKLELNQSLKINLSLEMKLSIHILKMGLNELKDFLQKKELQNPELEIVYSKSKYESKDSMNYLENISEKEESLIDYLDEQIMYLNLKKELKEILFNLINNLDERGYINGNIEELNTNSCFKLLDLKEALDILRKLEPSGVGAMNLVDCLKIQIKNKGIKDEVLEDILEKNLKDIADKNFFKISLERKIEIDRVKNYIELIKTLNPKPARGYFVNKKTEYIIPDLIVDISEKSILINLNKSNIPKISIKKTISEKVYKEALILERCIEKRNKTLYRVGEYILNYQKNYFLNDEPLKTLKIKEVALNLDLHESTISRAIKNKFIKIKNKTEPLRKYIVLNEKKEMIKSEILYLIENENKNKPLSDEEIYIIFLNKNIKINRRTIAKYRNEIGFLCSHKRKKR
ncbi:MAG: RNA polymerase factor sigma-54 [Cetobacterium sp.]